MLIGGCDGKVIHLAFEDNVVAVDETRIEARFMNSGLKAKLTEESVSVFFPKSRRFWVTLHGG